jgi:hypothetical protein
MHLLSCFHAFLEMYLKLSLNLCLDLALKPFVDLCLDLSLFFLLNNDDLFLFFLSLSLSQSISSLYIYRKMHLLISTNLLIHLSI